MIYLCTILIILYLLCLIININNMIKLVNITYNSSDNNSDKDYYPIEIDECLISNDYDKVIVENDSIDDSDIIFE